MAPMTTTISSIPLLRHRDTVINFPADQDDFVTKYEATNDHLSVTTVTELNAFKDQANALEANVNAKEVLAEEYGNKVGVTVEAGTYSAKEFAIGDLTATGGSAKAWATDTNSPDGTTSKSAKTLAGEATSSADIATTQAGLADTARIAAQAAQTATEAVYDTFDDRELGSKSSAPTLDNDGNALLEGAQYWNSTSKKKFIWDGSIWVDLTVNPTDHGSLTGLADDDHTQYHNDTRGDARYYTKAQSQEKLVSGTNIKSINGTTILGSGDLSITSVLSVEYASRSTLRSLTPSEGDKALVKELGLFEFVLGSTELDDDETSFATTSGVWLLQCPTYDFIEAQLGYYERIFTGYAINTIITVNSVSIATQDVSVNGAQIGMPVAVSLFGLSDGTVSLYAYVIAPNMVRVVVSNPSAAASATLPTQNWQIAVFAQN